MAFFTGTDIDVDGTLDVDITDAATVEIDFSAGNDDALTVTASILDAPTGEIRASLTPTENTAARAGTWYYQAHVVQAGGEEVRADISSLPIEPDIAAFKVP